MAPPFDFGNRVPPPSITLTEPASYAVAPVVTPAPVSRAIILDDVVLIALISRAIRNHNLAAQLIEANVYWNLFGQIQDPARNYYFYNQQVCTNCGKVSSYESSNLLTSRCWQCSDHPPILATESHLCDTLEFSLAKLTEPAHDLLMEFLSYA